MTRLILLFKTVLDQTGEQKLSKFKEQSFKSSQKTTTLIYSLNVKSIKERLTCSFILIFSPFIHRGEFCPLSVP